MEGTGVSMIEIAVDITWGIFCLIMIAALIGYVWIMRK